ILLLLLVGWLLWRKGIRPQWQRYRKAQQAEAEARMFKATQMKTPLVADDVISDDMDEKTRRRLTRQRVSAEIQSQRIREMADKDPQVVAMVISQWLGKTQ
ncbi:flagellar MS-ring protein, partial [Morganella morganii]